MGYQIFEMADGERVAVYGQGNSIFSCLLPFARGAVPREIRSDYLAHLEAVVFRDTVCFVYENLEHRVVLGTLGAGPSRILLTDRSLGLGIDCVHLVVREGELYLFYRVREIQGESSSLYVCMPYQENVRGRVFEGPDAPVEVYFLRTAAGAAVVCVDQGSMELRIFDWKQGVHFEERLLVEKQEHEQKICALRAAWSEEKENWAGQREEIQAEALARLGEFQQEKEERLIQCRREYEGRVFRLREEYEGKMAKCREEYESQLGRAKKQYEELAETAVKLQQIGRKWRDKYFEREREEKKQKG